MLGYRQLIPRNSILRNTNYIKLRLSTRCNSMPVNLLQMSILKWFIRNGRKNKNDLLNTSTGNFCIAAGIRNMTR